MHTSICHTCGLDNQCRDDLLCRTLKNEDLFWDLQEQKILDFGENDQLGIQGLLYKFKFPNYTKAFFRPHGEYAFEITPFHVKNFVCQFPGCKQLRTNQEDFQQHQKECQFNPKPQQIPLTWAQESLKFVQDTLNTSSDVHSALRGKFGPHDTTKVINSIIKDLKYRITSQLKQKKVKGKKINTYTYTLTQIDQ